MVNQTIAKILNEMAEFLEIKGAAAKSTVFRKLNYQKAARTLGALNKDISLVYKESGIAGIKKTLGVGDKMAKKIEEYLKKKKIKDYEKLKEETAIQQIIAHYFQTKGLSLAELKQSAKKRRIVYSRFTKPAKQLLDLAGSIEKAKETMTKVAEWANSRGLDYSIETVFKKWLEMDRLKPKEVVKKPYFWGNPIIWSEAKKKWYVISPTGDWLEFAGKESEIEWRIVR